MLVEYTRANVFSVHLSTGVFVRFIPGVNEIEPALWEQIQKHPTVAQIIGGGFLKALNEPEKGLSDPGLSGLNTKEAIAVVKKTVDADLLKKWALIDNRKAVSAAIQEQISAVDLKPEKE